MLITLLPHPPIIFIQNFVIFLGKKNRLQKCYFLEKASYNRNLSFTYENVLRNYRLTELLTAQQGLHEYNKKWSKELIFWEKKNQWDASVMFPMYPFSTLWKHLKTVRVKVFWCFQGVEKGCNGNKCVTLVCICNDFLVQFHWKTFWFQSCSGKEQLISLEPIKHFDRDSTALKALSYLCLWAIKMHQRFALFFYSMIWKFVGQISGH